MPYQIGKENMGLFSSRRIAYERLRRFVEMCSGSSVTTQQVRTNLLQVFNQMFLPKLVRHRRANMSESFVFYVQEPWNEDLVSISTILKMRNDNTSEHGGNGGGNKSNVSLDPQIVLRWDKAVQTLELNLSRMPLYNVYDGTDLDIMFNWT